MLYNKNNISINICEINDYHEKKIPFRIYISFYIFANS